MAGTATKTAPVRRKKTTKSVKTSRPTKPVKTTLVAKRTRISLKPHVNIEALKSHTTPYQQNIGIFASVLLPLVAAQVALLINPLAGAYVTVIALALLVGLALWKEKARQLAISAAILPVATMVSLSLPQSDVYANTMVFYDALLLLAMVYRFMFTLDYPLPYTKLGVKGYAYLLPFMIVTGQVLGAIGFGLLRHNYEFTDVSLLLAASTAVVMAITEETFFRGLIQQRGSVVLHPVMAAVLATVLYAATMFNHTAVWAPIFALLAGAVLSITYYKKQNLVLTTTINAIMKLVYIGLLATFVLR